MCYLSRRNNANGSSISQALRRLNKIGRTDIAWSPALRFEPEV
jgi:hypothetical protein